MRLTLATLLAASALTACAGDAPGGDETNVVTVYSARHYDGDKAMFDAFEADTGITVQLRESRAPQLLETLKAEGASSPADVIIASDVGALWQFEEAGLTQASTSDALTAAIPDTLRDPDGHWYGLAKRFRVIAYDPERLSPDQVATYDALADPALEGEVCARSSSNIYNLSLLSSKIVEDGEDAASAWAQGVSNNLARPPQGGDTAQIEAVAAGECSAAIANHYYWVRLAASNADDRREIAEATALSFPDQDAGGAHVNITGAAVTASAPNAENAIALIEWLATSKGQELLVAETKEYPIVEGVPLPAGLETLPDFTASEISLDALGPLQGDAQKLYTAAGWD